MDPSPHYKPSTMLIDYEDGGIVGDFLNIYFVTQTEKQKMLKGGYEMNTLRLFPNFPSVSISSNSTKSTPMIHLRVLEYKGSIKLIYWVV